MRHKKKRNHRRKPTSRRKSTSRRRSSSARRGRRRAYANPRRRNPSYRRRNPSYRRRNPTARWGNAFLSTLIGFGTGAVSYGVNWGVEYIPVSPLWRSVIFGSGGLAASVALSKWASPVIGAGFGGGVGALLTARVVNQVRLAQITKKAGSPHTPAMGPGASGARLGNPRFRTQESGAVFHRETGAVPTMRAPVFGPSFKREAGAVYSREAGAVYSREAGASRFVQGPVRFYGPKSWAYDTGRPRYVSAHNR